MDERFRAELLELNELHWKRFEAFMDARFAAADRKMERHFASRVAASDARMSRPLGSLDACFDRFEANLDRLFDRQIRLMIVLWLATVIPLGGLMVGLVNSIR